MEIVIIGDTHIPSRSTDLPTSVMGRVRSSTHTIHTGDIGSLETHKILQTLSEDNLTAVCGDKDPDDLPVPPIATVEFENTSFVVIHRSTGSGKRLESIAETVRKYGETGAIGVTGHTHEPADQVVDGVRILNPGSATGAHPATSVSFITVEIEADSVDVTIHERKKTLSEKLGGYWSRLKTSLRG